MRTGSPSYFLPGVEFPSSPPLKRGVGRNWEECQFPKSWGTHFPRSMGMPSPQFPSIPQSLGRYFLIVFGEVPRVTTPSSQMTQAT
jgi:hypothetical protein